MIPWPNHPDDLLDGLVAVQAHLGRDDFMWAKRTLRELLDEYPWSQEAADLYGYVCGKTAHLESPVASYRLHEWMAQHAAIARHDLNPMDDNCERFAVMKEWMFSWLLQHDPESDPSGVVPWARVVEIGAGLSDMAIHWASHPSVEACYASDLSALNGCYGHRYYYTQKLHHLAAFGDRLPFNSAYFDIAVISGTLEHVLDPWEVLRETRRVLRPGGLMLVQCPYGGMEGGQRNAHADELSFRSHVHAIDPNQVLGTDALLHYAEVNYTNSIWLPHGWYGTVYDWCLALEKVGT